MAITKEFLDSCRPPEAATAPVAADAQHQTPPPGSPILARLGIDPAQPGAKRGGGGHVQHHICIAVGTSAHSNQITAQHQLTFEGFVRMLKAWPVHVGSLTLAGYQRLKGGSAKDKARAAHAKDCSWYSLARFDPGTRTAANVVEVTGMILDFDGDPALTCEQISAPLGDVTHLITSTCSHHPDAPRWRLVVPYTRPVSPAEHAGLFDHFAALYPPGAVDTSARDASRLWFGPGCWSDTVEHREFHVQAGARFFDPDAALTASNDTPGELPRSFAARQPILVNGPHPNDALAYSPDREKPDAEQVRRMLACIKLEDAAGKRRGPWLRVLQGVHENFGGSEEGFQLIHEWSAMQPGYIDEADVRAIWDSLGRYSGKRVHIGSVVEMAIDGGFTFDPPTEEDAVDGSIPPDVESAAYPAAIRAVKERVDSYVAAGDTKPLAALRVLEEDLVFVADQQAYRSQSDRLFLNPYSIRQKFKAAMPRGANGQRLDPCRLLENSVSKRIVSALDYHPGESQIFARADGRLKLNDYEAPAAPWRLKPDAHVKHCTAALFALAVLDPTDASRLADKYAYLLQHMGARIPHATVVVGELQGTGKTFVTLDLLRALFGEWNVVKIGQQELDSDFTDYLAHAQILCVEEIAAQHSRDAHKLYNVLKDPLTSPTLRIHPKGLKAYDVANHMSVFASSNYPDAMALVPKDRRWDIMAARPVRLPSALARDMRQILDSPDGRAMLRDVFLSRDVSKLDIFADPPETKAKKDMEAAHVGQLGEELQYMEENRIAPFDRDFGTLDQVRTALAIRVRRLGETSPARLGTALKRTLNADKRKRRLDTATAQWVWFWRNQSAWLQFPESKLMEHLQTGAQPIGLVIDNTAPAWPAAVKE